MDRSMLEKRVTVDQRRVIVDTRDAGLDLRMPIGVVRERYALGHLVFDCTNGQYCVPENGRLPTWAGKFERWTK